MFTALRPGILKILLLTVQVFSSAPVQEEKNDSGAGPNDRSEMSDDVYVVTSITLVDLIGILVSVAFFWLLCLIQNFLTKVQVTAPMPFSQQSDTNDKPKACSSFEQFKIFKHDDYDYQNVADLSSRCSIAFAVKAESGAHVLLTADNGSWLEIVLGSLGGCQSVIRNKEQGPALVQEDTSPLDVNKFVFFKLSWQGSDLVLYTENQCFETDRNKDFYTPIMTLPQWRDSCSSFEGGATKIKSMAVSTGRVSLENWKIFLYF